MSNPNSSVYNFPLKIRCGTCEEYVDVTCIDLKSKVQSALYICERCKKRYLMEAPRSWSVMHATNFFPVRPYQVVWCC